MLGELKQCFMEVTSLPIHVWNIYIENKFDLFSFRQGLWRQSGREDRHPWGRAISGQIDPITTQQPRCSFITIIITMHDTCCLFSFVQLAQLLPMEENFLLLFRFDNPLDSSVEFMKVYLSFQMYWSVPEILLDFLFYRFGESTTPTAAVSRLYYLHSLL